MQAVYGDKADAVTVYVRDVGHGDSAMQAADADGIGAHRAEACRGRRPTGTRRRAREPDGRPRGPDGRPRGSQRAQRAREARRGGRTTLGGRVARRPSPVGSVSSHVTMLW